jgi:CHRD domain
MKQSAGLIALIVFVAGVSFVLSAQEPQHGGRPITITMTGAAEVPGPGDPDGTGTATITLNPGKGEVCYEMTVDKIAAANAAHLHSGAVDKAGPPVLTLKAPTGGPVKECAALERDIVLAIIKNPENYYVNVHNAEFPDGAVRGQLGKKK